MFSHRVCLVAVTVAAVFVASQGRGFLATPSEDSSVIEKITDASTGHMDDIRQAVSDVDFSASDDSETEETSQTSDEGSHNQGNIVESAGAGKFDDVKQAVSEAFSDSSASSDGAASVEDVMAFIQKDDDSDDDEDTDDSADDEETNDDTDDEEETADDDSEAFIQTNDDTDDEEETKEEGEGQGAKEASDSADVAEGSHGAQEKQEQSSDDHESDDIQKELSKAIEASQKSEQKVGEGSGALDGLDTGDMDEGEADAKAAMKEAGALSDEQVRAIHEEEEEDEEAAGLRLP